MLDPTDFNCLCYALALCHSFKGCALPPSLLFHALFLSPIQAHKVASTIFWRDNQKIAGLGREISNPLILPSTGHTGDLGDTQLQSGDPRRSTCLDMPRDLVLEKFSCLNLLGDPPVPGVPGDCHALTCPGTQFSGGHHASTCPGTPFSGGRHASACPGIRSLGDCHASACLEICTLTQGHLALRLQQFWVG